MPGRRVDDHVQVQLRYANGARGLLWASQVACGEENHLRLRVYGTRAALHWDQEQPNELVFQPAGQPAQRLTRGMAHLPAAAAAATRKATWRLSPRFTVTLLKMCAMPKPAAARLRASPPWTMACAACVLWMRCCAVAGRTPLGPAWIEPSTNPLNPLRPPFAPVEHDSP